MIFINRCKYPSCGKGTTSTWALVPVCQKHRNLIHDETMRYYRRSIKQSDRIHYQKIQRLTPWG